ncbi:class A basic helix-loop-helix protein 9-like [Rattus rattus]|uniref:class A basic helix-loop-helix protein 9-like n=1 Tax=Rattus rattus TaxID=10117 RepID=UPI0013F2B56C|nr:class A basic helix-loop-helix protein 9-like [Rattus rattus]
MPIAPSPAQSCWGGDPIVRRERPGGHGRGGGGHARFAPLRGCPCSSGGPDCIQGGAARDPQSLARPRCLPRNAPCQTLQRPLRAGPAPLSSVPRQRRSLRGCGDLGGGRAVVRAPSPGRRSPGWLQSLGKMVPSPPPGTVNQRPPLARAPAGPRVLPSSGRRPHLPAATCAGTGPPGKLLRPRGRGGGATWGRGGRSPPPSPLTFHGG